MTTASFADLPAFAAWRFVGAVDGFEVVYARPGRPYRRLDDRL